jgi:putative molybdopterin biosynthesis protein
MMEIDLALRWQTFVDGEAIEIDELLFSLLRGIDEAGQLNSAAKAEGVSYRHAWGVIRAWEARLGAPLLVSVQGRGASLTTFATGLLQARAETELALQPTLTTNALLASATINSAIEKDRRQVRIASSHDDTVLRLRESLDADRREVTLEIVGSEGALRRYRRGDADIAGFHMPMGELGRTVAAKLIASLDDEHDQVFLIEQRILGLMSRIDKPCHSIEELVSSDLRFVNRQAGATTRLTFDGLLGARGLAPGEISGYHDEEYTHTAVGALVVSRDVDVAFGSQSAAAHFDLNFEPMVEERFYIVINREFDSAVRDFVSDFCTQLEFDDRKRIAADEFGPTLAVIKRVHNAE